MPFPGATHGKSYGNKYEHIGVECCFAVDAVFDGVEPIPATFVFWFPDYITCG
jgi:hypothetical protein